MLDERTGKKITSKNSGAVDARALIENSMKNLEKILNNEELFPSKYGDDQERYKLYDTRCCVEQDTKKVFLHPQSKHFSNCYTFSSSVFGPKEGNAEIPSLAPELSDSKKRHFPEKQGASHISYM